MRHAIVPQDAQQVGLGIGLDRIKQLARKLLDEETGSARRSVRAQQGYRLYRAAIGDCDGGATVRGFR